MKTKKNDAATTMNTASDLLKDPKVQDAVTVIRRALSTASKHDLANRYVIGEKVQTIRSSAPSEKYGKKVVSAIAKQVGVSSACLYQYADVARTWDRGCFDEVGLRAAKVGLSFSHFVELAHADHAGERGARLEEAIADRLSVRQLRGKRVAASSRPKTIDVLERLRVEGPSQDLYSAVEKALKTARLDRDQIEERIHELEVAKKHCSGTMAPESGVALVDGQKAAE